MNLKRALPSVLLAAFELGLALCFLALNELQLALGLACVSLVALTLGLLLSADPMSRRKKIAVSLVFIVLLLGGSATFYQAVQIRQVSPGVYYGTVYAYNYIGTLTDNQSLSFTQGSTTEATATVTIYTGVWLNLYKSNGTGGFIPCNQTGFVPDSQIPSAWQPVGTGSAVLFVQMSTLFGYDKYWQVVSIASPAPTTMSFSAVCPPDQGFMESPY